MNNAIPPDTAHPESWRIERNAKLHFRVARTLEDGPDFIRSASGKVSSFKTWAGALRALKRAVRMGGSED